MASSRMRSCSTTCTAMRNFIPACERTCSARRSGDGSDRRAALLGLAAGYEATARVGVAIDMASHRHKGWRATGTAGSFGAAAAAARLLNLDAHSFHNAFAAAGGAGVGQLGVPSKWRHGTVSCRRDCRQKRPCFGSWRRLASAAPTTRSPLVTVDFLGSPATRRSRATFRGPRVALSTARYLHKGLSHLPQFTDGD